MELRSVDPRNLKPNPNNPRKIAADEVSDQSLRASIQTIGILQPPVVRQQKDDLVIVAGARRMRAAIDLDLKEIVVLVRGEDDGGDGLRSLSENVVRAPMSTVDLWRAIEALTSDNWTQDAIADALAVPVRQIRKLKLLANIHPAILDQIGAGDMPKEEHLRTIAAASNDEQASVWKKLKPKKGQTATWWEIARALEKRRIYARVAKFGPDEGQAFRIVWEEDLFSQGDEDSRYTTQVEAFFAAQQAWMEAHLPKNGVALPHDDYGNPKLPPKAERVWTKPKKGDAVGQCVNPRDGSIVEVVFRQPKPEPKKGQSGTIDAENDDAPSVAKTRPEITQKGMAIIGDLRTEALAKALLEDTIDDAALIGLLVLSFSAANVTIRTGDYSSSFRTKIVQTLTAGGKITQDLHLLRQAARETLASFLSSRPGMNDSGMAARFAGDVIGADAHLPNMATEDFLSCLSKSALEKAAASLGVLPRPRAKETRAALIEQAGNGIFVLPAALFAPTEAELKRHQEAARSNSCGGHQWDDDAAAADTLDSPLAERGENDEFGGEPDDRDDDADNGDETDPSSSARGLADNADDAFDDHDEDADENAHHDDNDFDDRLSESRAARGAREIHLGRA